MTESIVQIILGLCGVLSLTLVWRYGWWRCEGPDRPGLVRDAGVWPFAMAALFLLLAQAMGALALGPATPAQAGAAIDLADRGRLVMGTYGAGLVACGVVILGLGQLIRAREGGVGGGEGGGGGRGGGAGEPADAAARAGLSFWRGSPRRAFLQAGGALLLVLPICALVNAAMAIIAHLTTGLPADELAHETLRVLREAWSQSGQPGHEADRLWITVIALGAVVGAPIVEEVVFRVCVQSGLLAWTGRRAVSIGATSVLFVLMHIGSAAWYTLPALGVLSIALGIAYERTGRVGVPILIHAGFNAVNVLLAVFLSLA